MSSMCFEPKGSYSGRWLYIQVCYSVFYMHHYKQSCRQRSVWSNTLFYLQDCLYHTCIYNCLPEDEPTGLKHVEDIKKIKYQNINFEKVQLYCIKNEGRINHSLGKW